MSIEDAKYMVHYGIKMSRPFWVSLLMHLPILNLLWTRKTEMHVTTMRSGRPVSGTFRTVRIPRSFMNVPATIKIRYALCDYGDDVHITMKSLNKNYRFRILGYTRHPVRSYDWYFTSIDYQYERDYNL